jgi:hypothetical protein
MPKLVNWRLIDCMYNRISLKQVEYGTDVFYLEGNVIDDNRFLKGELIHTSKVVDFGEDLSWCQTKNTLYNLGKMLPENEIPKRIIPVEELPLYD